MSSILFYEKFNVIDFILWKISYYRFYFMKNCMLSILFYENFNVIDIVL